MFLKETVTYESEKARKGFELVWVFIALHLNK